MSEVGYFTFHKKEALKQKLTVHIPSSPVTGIFLAVVWGGKGLCRAGSCKAAIVRVMSEHAVCLR